MFHDNSPEVAYKLLEENMELHQNKDEDVSASVTPRGTLKNGSPVKMNPMSMYSPKSPIGNGGKKRFKDELFCEIDCSCHEVLENAEFLPFLVKKFTVADNSEIRELGLNDTSQLGDSPNNQVPDVEERTHDVVVNKGSQKALFHKGQNNVGIGSFAKNSEKSQSKIVAKADPDTNSVSTPATSNIRMNKITISSRPVGGAGHKVSMSEVEPVDLQQKAPPAHETKQAKVEKPGEPLPTAENGAIEDSPTPPKDPHIAQKSSDQGPNQP